MNQSGETYRSFTTLVEIDSIIDSPLNSPQWNTLTLPEQVAYWAYLNVLIKIKFEQYIDKFGGESYSLSLEREQYFRKAISTYLFNEKLGILRKSEPLNIEPSLMHAMILQDLTRIKLAISQVMLALMQEPRASYIEPRLFIKAHNAKNVIWLDFTHVQKYPSLDIQTYHVNGQAIPVDSAGIGHYTSIATRPGKLSLDIVCSYMFMGRQCLGSSNYEAEVK
jgi:hypothetical protein